MRSSKPNLPAYTRSVITLRQLLRDVSAGIRVLQTRDGLDLSEAQINERSRNIVAGLIGNYRIESMDLVNMPRPRSPEERAQAADDDTDTPAPVTG